MTCADMLCIWGRALQLQMGSELPADGVLPKAKSPLKSLYIAGARPMASTAWDGVRLGTVVRMVAGWG